jgi:hypothetical protein
MTIAEDKKRSDFETLIKIITDNTGFDPTMWKTAIE